MRVFKATVAVLLIVPNYSVASDLKSFYQCEGYEPVALTKLSTGHDVISVELNGVDARFVLDTGAKISIIDARFLDKYRIDQNSKIGDEVGAGAAGKILLQTYPLESMRINNHTLDVSKIGTVELSQIINGLGRSTGVWVDGIIGQDVLLTHFGIVDNRRKKLFLKPKSQHKNGCGNQLQLKTILGNKGYHAIPLPIISLGLATIKVAINDEPGEFILDSGAGSVIVNSGSLAKFNLHNHRALSSQSSSGAGGAFTLKTIELESIQIGKKDYEVNSINTLDLSTVVNEVKTRSGIETQGVIGQDFLQKYRSIISFHDNVLYLKQ
jgi:predicted aspartyl protease